MLLEPVSFCSDLTENYVLLHSFFLASRSTPYDDLLACFHCRKAILLAWPSDDSCWSLTLQECFYGLTVCMRRMTVASEWICKLALFVIQLLCWTAGRAGKGVANEGACCCAVCSNLSHQQWPSSNWSLVPQVVAEAGERMGWLRERGKWSDVFRGVRLLFYIQKRETQWFVARK